MGMGGGSDRGRGRERGGRKGERSEVMRCLKVGGRGCCGSAGAGVDFMTPPHRQFPFSAFPRRLSQALPCPSCSLVPTPSVRHHGARASLPSPIRLHRPPHLL